MEMLMTVVELVKVKVLYQEFLMMREKDYLMLYLAIILFKKLLRN
jgi:hypothetical protein